MKKKATTKIFEYLEMIAQLLPAPVYWLDIDQKYLGVNKHCLEVSGTKSYEKDFSGKTPYDLYPKKMAEEIVQHHQEVVRTGKILSAEESIIDITTKAVKYFNAFIAPLCGDDGKIIGTIGISIDVTQSKKETEQLSKANIIKSLEDVTPMIHIPVYWLDEDGRMLGINNCFKEILGLSDVFDPIGKTAYDVYPKEIAEEIARLDQKVIRTGETLCQEEVINNFTTRKDRYLSSVKAPLRNNQGKIIGIIGTSIDITDRKNAERLEIEKHKLEVENKIHEQVIQEQEKFRKIAGQVAHDIRSPLSSLLMVVAACKNIPEMERIILKESATNISDIANNLLSHYKKHDSETSTAVAEAQPILVSLVLLEVISEKKYQYKKLPVKFNCSLDHKNSFVFILADPSNFYRMLSNLINNAVEAFEGKAGEVDLKLNLTDKNVEIIVQDNGKGMSPEIIKKIISNITVTSGKEDGSGIGLSQVRGTLAANYGRMAIESKVGVGTKITLTFLQAKPAGWIATKIDLNEGDIIVVLDDDSSIHGAWKSKFKPYESKIKLQHFQSGAEALEFIQGVKSKEQLFLLSDFELLQQKLDGLQVIASSKLQRAMLVTSHYNDREIRKRATKDQVKILPKQLASDIVVNIGKNQPLQQDKKKVISNFREVDAVVIDDDRLFVSIFVDFFQYYSLTANAYHYSKFFLEKLDQYAQDTMIFIDNNFGSNHMSGIELAINLHKKGYTRLYLLSGQGFSAGELPSYLTGIVKTDLDTLCNVIQQFSRV